MLGRNEKILQKNRDNMRASEKQNFAKKIQRRLQMSFSEQLSGCRKDYPRRLKLPQFTFMSVPTGDSLI